MTAEVDSWRKFIGGCESETERHNRHRQCGFSSQVHPPLFGAVITAVVDGSSGCQSLVLTRLIMVQCNLSN